MKTAILMAPVCELKSLDNIFIELTAKNCNQRCNSCYIDFPISRKVKDFIPVETVKKALEDTKNENIQCVYLTGAEPMTHPDFNSILRLCLRYSNTCICTNGSLINEKKARFLKRVQDEGEHEIIFKLSLAHYTEAKNDAVRSRGSYRQVISAIKYLIKYNFNPIISVANYYKEDRAEILRNLKSIFENIGFIAQDRNISINEWYNSSDTELNYTDNISAHPDCENGRIVTAKGIYTCPFLANDHRGRCGSDFMDFSAKVALESPYCNTCLNNLRQVFGINLSEFNN